MEKRSVRTFDKYIMMYFTYHDFKVNTDKIAYPNRVGRGQFLTLEFDNILRVHVTYRYFKVKNDEMAYLLLQRRRMVKWEKEGCPFSTLKFDNIYTCYDILVIKL